MEKNDIHQLIDLSIKQSMKTNFSISFTLLSCTICKNQFIVTFNVSLYVIHWTGFSIKYNYLIEVQMRPTLYVKFNFK